MVGVYIESEEGKAKKSALEAVTYGRLIADNQGVQCIAILVGNNCDCGELASAGAQKVVMVEGGDLSTFSPEGHSAAVYQACKSEGINTLVLAGTYSGKSVAPKCAIKMNAAFTSGVVTLPEMSGGFSLRKSCFSNKAFTDVQVKNENKVISIIPNSIEIQNFDGSAEEKSLSFEGVERTTESIEIDKVKGKIPLTEAELVVSAGRGMKGPENWEMVEELADILGAATACSKPVSDMDWRPHSEHVGQTGITIKPNLYIAIGISGAIQHLAGVSSSKVICVINTDPEAPFFKVADYGIVGDAFEVLPKLIARAKELKAS